ncbi:hypothetical protein J2X37_003029 [Croceicoccus sp. BE223]|nr:hypothetical protein [Croceicoccus sp. BE223]
MEMALRFLRAARVVLEQADDQVAGWNLSLPFPVIDTRLCRVLFRPGQRCFHRLAISLDNPPVPAHQRNQRPALGDRKCEVDPGTVDAFAPHTRTIRQFTA